jgi:hypothetical protein
VRREVLRRADFFLDFVEAFIYEFQNIAALKADEVVMMWPTERFFVPR